MKKNAFTTLVLALVGCMFIFCACSDNTEEIRNGEFKSIALATVGVEDGEIEYSNVVEETSGDFVVEIVIQGIRYDVTIGADKTVKSVKINDRSVGKEHVPCSPFSPNCGYIGKQAAKRTLSDASRKTRIGECKSISRSSMIYDDKTCLETLRKERFFDEKLSKSANIL